MAFEGIGRFSKLLDSFHFPISYKTKFNAALVIFLIRLDMLQWNKGVKRTKKVHKISENVALEESLNKGNFY